MLCYKKKIRMREANERVALACLEPRKITLLDVVITRLAKSSRCDRTSSNYGGHILQRESEENGDRLMDI